MYRVYLERKISGVTNCLVDDEADVEPEKVGMVSGQRNELLGELYRRFAFRLQDEKRS